MSDPIIKDLSITDYLRKLADDWLFPSAGAAAGLTAAQAAALFAMVCRVNLRKLRDGEAAEPVPEKRTIFWGQRLELSEKLGSRCLELAQEDGAAYRDVVDGDPHGPARAMEVPLDIARCSLELAGLIRRALPISYAPVRADAETALVLARGSFRAGLVVARYNLPLIKDQAARDDYVNLISALKHKAELDPAQVNLSTDPEAVRQPKPQ